MSGSSAISGQLLVFLARSPKVPTLDGRNVNGQPSLPHTASIFPVDPPYSQSKLLKLNVQSCLGSRESIDASLFFYPVLTNFGANGAQGVIITAGHLGPFFLLSSDRQGFLPKRLGVPVVQGKIGHRTVLAVGSVLEYPLWLQGVPGRSPGAKCIVFVSFKHV